MAAALSPHTSNTGRRHFRPVLKHRREGRQHGLAPQQQQRSCRMEVKHQLVTCIPLLLATFLALRQQQRQLQLLHVRVALRSLLQIG